MARGSPPGGRVGLALALICVITQHGQATDTCRSGCRGTSQTFKYAEGTTYKYNFDSKIQVTLSSAEGQQSLTEIKATVLITQQPQCNQLLRLQNVQVISNDGKKHGNIPDVDKPIRVNYHDGHLEDSICITPGDSQNSLNLKRAIASLLQANLKSGYETDIFGVCQTEVSHHKEGNTLIIQKTRNLNSCAFRESISQDFLSTAFNLNSEIKSSPLLNSDYEATLKIKNGILDLATVKENYLYLPFSVGSNGAKTNIETTLKYVGNSKDNPQVGCSQPRSIIFEDPHPVHSPHSNVNSILGAVKQVAKTIGLTVGENTAKEFINLVRILRVSKKDDLLAVYNQVRAGVGFSDKTTGKKIFLDALLRAGNGDNIEVAIELLKNKELDLIEQNLVYLGLSTVRHATENSLNSAVQLLNQPHLPRSAYLGIGNLAGRFCRQHSCENVEAVHKLTEKLVQKLGNGKAANRQEENDIVFVLKALGNTHHLDENILGKITGIAQDKKAPIRVRVTALETYLADPCKDKLRESALTILKDIQQDAEVRIKAYLALAQCPNSKVGNAVKALLENEPSYQVGGFIVTHIRNLRASANPDKQLAKQHLGFINVPKRFPFDLRKYSANGEFSYTIDSLGLANSIESNLIYSQSSFLPRSTSLNLTTEIFGHNFNFLEIETRQENLDRLVEHYFGPEGLFRSKSLHDLWHEKEKGVGHAVQNFRERLVQKLRSRRDLSKAELDHVNKQIQIKTNELNSDLDLDLSIRTFGSELLFLNINDDFRKFTPEAIIDKIADGFGKSLDKLKHFEETLRTNLLFLDAELAYPTSSGFPLRLGVEGTSNIQVKASGSVDVRALLNNGESTLKLSLIPSANIEVAGRLTLDTQVVESGLKIISNLYTATGGDLIAEIHKQSVDVKFALPLKEQQILSASHNIVFHIREWGAPEVNSPLKFNQKKPFSVCLDQLEAAIGLSFCGKYQGPNLQGDKVPILPFPFSGDAAVAVSIDNEDLKEYHFKEILHSTNDKIGAEILVEAFGKDGKKKASLVLEGSLLPEKVIRASLNSALINLAAEGRITSTNTEKSASLRFQQDNIEYFGKIGVSIQGSPAKAVYQPILQYKTPQSQDLPLKVQGQVVVETKSPSEVIYNLDNIKVMIPTGQNFRTLGVSGKFGTEPETVYADVTLSDGNTKATFNGKLRLNPNLIKYNAELTNSVNPQANIKIKGEIKKSPEEISNSFQGAHGGDFSNKKYILTIENFLKYRNKGPQDFLIETKNKLTYPAFDTNIKAEFELKPNAVEYDLDLQYNGAKLGSELEWEHHNKKEGTDFKLEFGIWGLNNKLSLKSKRQVAGEESQLDNSLELNGKRLEVNGKVKHHIKPQDIDVSADLKVRLPTHNTLFSVLGGLRLNPNEIDASQKVSSGSEVLIDVFLKANRGGNANGSIKVNLKGHLIVNGHVKANKGNGNGEITIELPAAAKTSKIDTTFNIHDPTFNFLINIYPIFNQDKNKKITASTHTSLTDHSIDSKNLIDIFGHKLEANVKGNQDGDIKNGKTHGEVEVTLPNQQYLTAKLNREAHNANGVINGNALAVAEYRENKNQPGSKFTFKGQILNTKPEEKIYDVTYQISGETSGGRNVNIDLGLKQQKHGDGSNYQFQNKITSSELSAPLELHVTGTCNNGQGTYDISSSYTPLGKTSIKGKYDLRGSPISGEIDLDVTSTSKSLNHLRVGVSGSLQKTNVIDAQGHLNVVAKAADGVIFDLDTQGQLKSSEKESRIKGSIKSGKLNPIAVDAGIGLGGDKQLKGDAALHFGDNKNLKGEFNLERVSPLEYKLDAKLDLPADKFKSNRLQVHSKRNEERTHFQSEVILTTDGKKWLSNSDILLSNTIPTVDIKVTCPEGKVRHVLFKITKLTDHQIAGQVKLVYEPKNFLFEGSIDGNFENIDDFHVKLTANSPALKIEKYVIEANNKAAKGGKRIQVNAKSGNKNILSGSSSYTSREDQGKLIIEGSGSFKLHDQSHTANFKYIRQNLNQAKNGETGIEISFDAGLGNKAIDAEFKATDKQFRILNSYCEEKKQCAHIEIDAKTAADLTSYLNEIEVAIDLRKLGLSHEFGLKAVTKRKEYVFDHTVDVHFQSQENSKYQYSHFIRPKEAGISLTTPKRCVAVEANVNVPPGLLKDGGKITGQIVLYPNKKTQPQQKSGLIAFLDLNTHDQEIKSELRYTSPALKRPLILSADAQATSNSFIVHATADVFLTPDQKITLVYSTKWSDVSNYLNSLEAADSVHIKSSGLGFDISYEEWATYSVDKSFLKAGSKLTYIGFKDKYVSLASYELTPKNLQIVFDLFNINIFKLNSQIQFADKHQVIDSEVTRYGRKPVVSHIELKNYNSLKFTIAEKGSPDKLQINTAFIPGQIADLRAEVIKGGASKELGHASVHLDDAKFLKSDYNINSKNIQEVLEVIKKGAEDDSKELKQLTDKVTHIASEELAHLGQKAKEAAVNLAPVNKYYISELEKIKNEILEDKTFHDASEFLYNIKVAIFKAFEGVFTSFSQFIENIAKSLQQSFGHIIEGIQKDVLPKLQELSHKFIDLSKVIFEGVSNIILVIGSKAAEIAETYRPEFQQLNAVLAELGQDVFKAFVSVYETLRNVILEQWDQIYKELKTYPAVQQLKNEYQRLVNEGFPTPEAVANSIQELFITLTEIAPTEELKEFVKAIGDYVSLVLKTRKIDDKASIDKIVKAASACGNQFVQILTGGAQPPELQRYKFALPQNIWSKLPRLAAVRFSPVSYILSEDLLVPYEFLLSLVNQPRNWFVPFPLYGLVAQGQHIFTFDGKHLTFPGKCNYVLAHDALDGNFTVTGSYNHGLLEAISLTQGSDTVTLKKGGQVLLNNAPTELPARKDNIAVYRNTERVTLLTKFGVKVICGPELFVCSVTASGFYHGKLRGLLGNGNNEPYDDFTLPTGKIVTSESEFGNSYKTTSGCEAVQTVSHHGHHSVASCDKLFSWESSLRLCYPFVSNANFRQACEHGVAAGVKNTEHAIAVAYVAACNQHSIPIRIPSDFVKCSNGDKPVSIGEEFTVKTPGKAADIVVLLDTSKNNEATYKEYVQPLIQQLTSDLAGKGVNDVQFHIIAFNGDNKWPSHLTTNGGKLTFKGKAPNVRFSENEKEETLGISNIGRLVDFIRDVCEDLKLAFGLDIQALTYNEGLSYPFRPNSIKTVLAVVSEPCRVGRFYPLQVLRTLLYRGRDINLNLITPISRIGAKSEAKNIVGFNARNVFALGQTKNKLKSFDDLGKELSYQDFCIDFTVQNDGNVFVSDHIHLQQKGQRKQFIQATSQGIIEQLLGTEKNYECECQFTSPYTATNVCRLESIREKSHSQKKATKN